MAAVTGESIHPDAAIIARPSPVWPGFLAVPALLAGSSHGGRLVPDADGSGLLLAGQPRLIVVRRDGEDVEPVEAGLGLADAARRAFDWIGSVAVDADGGLGWLEGGVLADDLYSGTAGVLLGCAEAAAAGLGTAQVSAGARARLLHLARHGPGVATMPDDGLFGGWAGIAVALRAWSRVTGDAAAAAAAGQVTAQIAERIVQAPAGRPQCTDVISGDAGILLALIADDSGAAVQAAHVLAGRLAEAAEPGPDGLHWRMTADREYLMPGFSHGTAGIAYALAAVGRTLNRSDLVDVAVRGARALLALGHHPGGWAVPNTIPPRPGGPAVAYGWCHGPAGTVRLFLLLNEIDPQPRWQHAIEPGFMQGTAGIAGWLARFHALHARPGIPIPPRPIPPRPGPSWL